MRRCAEVRAKAREGKIASAKIFTSLEWALNSDLECHLHTVEVIGSNPIAPTTRSLSARLDRKPRVPFQDFLLQLQGFALFPKVGMVTHAIRDWPAIFSCWVIDRPWDTHEFGLQDR